MADLLASLEAQHNIPSGMLGAVMQVESGGKMNAVSPAGAMGPFQLMGPTAAEQGVKNPFDINQAAPAAAKILAANHAKYGDWSTALAAYNAGGGAVDKAGGIPNNGETPAYVQKVNAAMPIDPTKVQWDDAQPQAQQAAPEQIDPSKVQWDQPAAQPATPAPQASPPLPGFLQGVGDFATGATRAIVHGMSGAANAIAPDSQFAKDAAASLPQMDAQTQANNAAYAQARAQQGKSGVDLARMAGQVAPSLAMPMSGGGVIPAALSGAASGAIQGAVNTGPGQSYAGNMAMGAGAGGVAGGAIGALGNAVGGANLSPAVQSLMKQGVTPTPGQAMGGYANTVENMLTSAPIVGPTITGARRAAVADMNRAAYQQVLDPIGLKAPTTVGRQAIEDIGAKIGNEYDQLLPRLTFQPDQQFYQAIAPISKQVQTLPQDAQKAYSGVLQRTLATQLRQGPVSGTAFKTMDSEIGREASNYMSSPDAYQRQIGQALQGVQGVMRDTLERVNPGQPTLAPINQAWKNFTVLRNAGARVNDPDMPIMPGQLQAAVKAGDNSVAKGNFAKGNANMQDLSDAGMSVLGNKYPDSGTAGREALMGQIAATAMHPAMAGLLPVQGLGAAAYGTQGGRQAMLALLAKRPDMLRQLGPLLSGAAPVAGAAAANALTKGQ